MKFPFRDVLLTLLGVLVLSTVISLGVSGYWTAHATAQDLTVKVLEQTSLVVDRQIQGLLLKADRQGEFTGRMFQAKALRLHDADGLARYFRTLMETFPELTGVFVGTEPDGECLGLSRLTGNRLMVWELRKNRAVDRLEIREYAPDDFPAKPSRVDVEGNLADCRRRPWYVDARRAGRQTWSRVYPFFMFHNVETVPGVTSATPLYDDAGKLTGVLAIDIRLDKLSDFLRTVGVGAAGFTFVVEILPDGTRHVIAHPDSEKLLRAVPGQAGAAAVELMPAEDIGDPRVPAFLARVPAGVDAATSPGATPVRFLAGGTPYLGTYRALDVPGLPRWLLCTVIPEDEVLARANAETRLAFLIGIGVLLVAALISYLVSRHFARSLVRLVRETEAVGRFQVEAREPVPSLLLEVDQLARATEQMKTSLRSFGRYVPADLVRQLLASGAEARLGGANRVLTIFFCDLADFTAISESLTPQQLVEQLGEYFHAFTEEVAASGGTVDKFIGDAVMAFWGAPVEGPDHAAAACRCALGCQRRLAGLRAVWKEQGRPLLFARIGINTGPVVVGNIGSARRFNYTVIGDAVNVASRLEGLNKFYGTSICVSEETFWAAGGAVAARPVDLVSVKGKSAPILVYELLGLTADTGAGAERLAEIHGRGLECYRRREWAAAIAEFEEVVRLRPGDGPAAEMLRRCHTFQREPPGADWDGVNRMDSK
jgi:adenylate cyclase